MIVEDWTYEANGKEIEGRQVWHVEPPGEKGSGIPYHVTHYKDVLGADAKWERHIHDWRLCDGRDPGSETCNCDPRLNEAVEVE